MTNLKKTATSPLFLYLYAVLSLAVPNVVLCFVEPTTLLAAVAGIITPVAAYALLMAMSANVGRNVWALFLLVFFAAFQLVLVYLYGGGAIAVDMFLNLVTTNPGEVLELLDNLLPAVLGVFVLYIPLLAIAAWQWRKGCLLHKEMLGRLRRVSAWMLGAGVAMTVACCAAYGRADVQKGRKAYSVTDDMYPVNVFYNLGLAVRESRLSATYEERVADFSFHARPTHAKDSAEVYVLVIGETSRSQNWQLYGYHRPTNPALSKEPGLMVFSRVRSQSNTTHKSVPMLLTAATASDHDRLYREKGLIAAFREAGFHTVFLSNQLRNHSYIDFLGSEANESLFIREAQSAGGEEAINDRNLIPYLQKALSAGHKKLLLVLHTYGSHFSYRDRYARSEARFLPDTPTEAKPQNRPSLLNGYDNTIIATDRLLATVIAMLRTNHCAAAMLYTSDHGENIFDDERRLFLHASPRPSRYDTDVPLILWASPEYASQHPAVINGLRSNLRKGVQTSASVFPTMLSLGGVSVKASPDSLSLANPRYRLGTRLYLDDHNRAVPLSMYGIDD